MRNIYVYQWRSKGGRAGRSAPGSKINPLESMIISDIMLKSKNKAANSGCNSTRHSSYVTDVYEIKNIFIESS